MSRSKRHIWHNACDYLRYLGFYFFFTHIYNESVHEIVRRKLDVERFTAIYIYDSLSLLIVMFRGNLAALLADMKKRLWTWIGWSLVGFGLMYAPVCYAAEYEPGWLIAGTWQVTIVAGSLLSPLFYKVIRTQDGSVKMRETIPLRGLMMSFIILLGVSMMQVGQIGHMSLRDVLEGIVPVIIAAFAYPLGNRKMMEVCEGRLDVYQRVLGMTLASLPLWLFLACYAFIHDGPPSAGQINQSLIVAVSAGIVATVLFFSATGMVNGSTNKLAAVEATQAGEVLFTAIGELLFLSVPFPSVLSWTGMLFVIAGMILHSLISGKESLNSRKNYNRSLGR